MRRFMGTVNIVLKKKSTGHEPHRIIFYRDGVSEGQFNEVLLYEMDKISKVFLLSTLIIIKHVKSTYVPFFNKYSWLIHPGLSFTGRKLHATCNIRCGSEEASYSFLPGDRGSTDKSGNVLPGTVLDTKICHPTEFDFYCVVMLVSRQREMENPCYRKLKQKSNGSLLETESEVKDCISRTCSRSKLIEYAEEVSPLCTKMFPGCLTICSCLNPDVPSNGSSRSPSRINEFRPWKISMDRLPTRVNLHRRGVKVSPISCPICCEALENLDHLLFCCDLAKDIARSICNWWGLVWNPVDSYRSWICLIGSSSIKFKNKCWKYVYTHPGGVAGH
ncbi:RNA-directed DNA polymerase, eukaryota [Tanacetum coccineum]